MMSAAFRAVRSGGLSVLAQKEIEAVLNAHQAYLQDSRTGQRAILISRHLAKLDLSNRALAGADLSGSTLSGASLKFADLSGANLYCCEMLDVDGRYANFTASDMRGVTLAGSNLSHARLDKCDFRPGRLMKSQPAGNDTVVDRNSSAPGVDFSYCSINGASFEGADLKGANFKGAIIIGSRFKDARMTGASFSGAILTDVDLSEMALSPGALEGAILPPGAEAMAQRAQILFQLNAHQNWVESGGTRGTSAVLDGKDLRPFAHMIGKFKLTAISARKVIAAGVDFSCTELQGANFEGADLRGASFEAADLRGVNFAAAQLRHAKFLGADMRPLELKNGGVLTCNVSDADFTPEQRAEAVFA